MGLAASLFAAAIACEEREKPGKPDTVTQVAAPATPAKTSTAAAGVGAPVRFQAAAKPTKYVLREVMTGDIADQPAAAHKLTLSYTVRPIEAKAPAVSAVELTVQRIELEAKRDDYKVKLDNERAGDMHRLRNGADTFVAFESIYPYALIDHPLRVSLDERGYAISVEGGDEVRKAMLAMHPANTAKDPKNRAKVDAWLSDRRLLDLLLPAAAVLPEDGDAAAGRRIDRNREESFGAYTAAVSEATLLRPHPGGTLRLQTKRVDAPAPDLEQSGDTIFAGGERELIVSFDTPSATFETAGMTDRRAFNYHGKVGEEEGEFPMSLEVTRIWERQP